MKRIHALFAALALALGAITTAQAFTHPGIPLTTADLDTIKANLNVEPWKSGYAALVADSHSQLSYTMQGPFANVSRNPNVNLNQWRNDMIAVWNLARMWYFTQNSAYAQKARDILIAWANTQTSFSGIESNLDLGDYAYRFGGGADILRGTWPGWTQADTDAVKNLFTNVYWPATSFNTEELGPTNKGSLSLAAAVVIAVFNDDQTKLDKVLYELRTFSSTGFRTSLSNGEHGETGRDQGHSYAHMLAMSVMAEVLWKQGIDVFSHDDNRLLAMGEYYARYNLNVPTPFVPMGTTDEYYMSIWDSPGFQAEPMAFSILKSAYVLRKGLSAPWIERKLAAQGVNAESFMFLKSADSSTATPPTPITFPATSRVSTGMTDADIGGAWPAGSSSYSNGIWTVSGQGNDIWTHDAEQFHYVYKQVTGDCALIAKVESVQDIVGYNKAGVMIRSDLNATPAGMAWVAIKPNQGVETYFHGWGEMWGGSNWEAQGYWISQPVWWVKVERLGNIVTTYASPDGTSWTVLVAARYDNLGASPYIGLCVTSINAGTLCTATFSNVSITSGDGVAPVAPPEAPLSLLASSSDGRVPLRWTESFGATSYNVKRSTASGGPFTTIATVTNPSHVDTSVTNGTTYAYVVSAVNVAGEGANSPEDGVTARPRLVGVGGNNLNWSYSSSTTGWLQYDLGAGKEQVVTACDVISGNDIQSRDPRDWLFQGSNDGSTWTTLDTQAGQSFACRKLPQRYYFSNATAYRYYRINITANNGDTTTVNIGGLAVLANVADLPVIAAPLNVAIGWADQRVTLSWSAPITQDGLTYTIKRGTSPGGPYTVIASGLTGFTYADTSVANGTTYYYVVSAVNGGSQSADSAEFSVTSSDLVLRLKFDETGGATAADSSNGGHDAALVNGAAFTGGKFINALGLASAGSQYATLPAGLVSTLKDFTISTWVKPVTLDWWARIFDFGTGTGGYMLLTTQGGSGPPLFGIRANGGSEQQVAGGIALTAGAWNHVAVTFSGSTAKLYVNGSLAGENTGMTAWPSLLGNTTQNYLGKSQFSADPYLNGALDDFRIYNRALSASEIGILAAGQLATPQNVTATSGSAQITLTWSAVTGASDYTIQRSASSGGPYTNLATGISGTTCVNTGLADGATWYYTVAANGLPGAGTASAPVTATTYTAIEKWRLAHFSTISNSGNAADTADPDGDGWTNAQEFAAGTNPTSAASVLKVSQMQASGNDMLISFPTVAGKTYRVERSSTLQSGSWTTVQDNIAGTGSTMQTTDTGGAAQPRRFYRVAVLP